MPIIHCYPPRERAGNPEGVCRVEVPDLRPILLHQPIKSRISKRNFANHMFSHRSIASVEVCMLLTLSSTRTSTVPPTGPSFPRISWPRCDRSDVFYGVYLNVGWYGTVPRTLPSAPSLCSDPPPQVFGWLWSSPASCASISEACKTWRHVVHNTCPNLYPRVRGRARSHVCWHSDWARRELPAAAGSRCLPR